jgi:WD40 repeat protein
VQFWDWQYPKDLDKTIKASNKASDFVSRISFSPDGKTLAVALSDGTVQFWDWQYPKDLDKTIKASNVSSISFSPDGKTLAVALVDRKVQFWDWQNQNNLDKTFNVSGLVLSLGFSPPDGKILAVGSDDGTVQVRDWSNQKDLDTFKVQDTLSSLSFSTDGKILIIASSKDKSVFIKTRTIYNLQQMLDQGCKWLQPYLTSNPKQKEESGCP